MAGSGRGGGRLRFEPVPPAPVEAPQPGEGVHLVDFNAAYHPFCVYDERYTCPLPPPENRLDVPVRAGERLPGEDHE